MTHGPIPPHERAWRHPSELPAPTHEPTSRSGRVLIASTATVGLLLVGFLALSMTPKRLGTAEPTGAVTSLVLTPLGSAAVEDATTPAARVERVLRVVSTFLTGTDTVPAGSDAAQGVNRGEPAATAVPSSPGDTESTPPAASDTAESSPRATAGAAANESETERGVGAADGEAGTGDPGTVSPVSEADVMLTSATGDAETGPAVAAGSVATDEFSAAGESTASDPAATATTATSTTTTTSTTSTTTIPASTTVAFTNAEKKFVNG